MERIKVKFYTVLRDKLGLAETEAEGATVKELLNNLSLRFGQPFKDELFDERGAIHTYYIIMLNDSVVEQSKPEACAVKKGDVLHIFPPIAGGMGTEKILQEAKKIAVVGLSPKEERPSNKVAKYLLENGYDIVPVNPGQSEILGRKCYASLVEIPEKIDIVDIFRRSEDVLPVVDDAVKIGAKCVWMQEGVVNEAAAKKAVSAGIEVIMDRCILKEHSKVFNKGG